MTDAPFRVLPALDDENRFFWTSGEDGQLRFLRCQACGFYLHPPLPRCPRCGSRDVAPEPVSGRGTVWSFTVNFFNGKAATEIYTIGLVELAEQEGLRLTTNIVGMAAEDVRVGIAVQVVFEQRDEVWFPLFEPVPDEGAGS